MKKPDSSEMEPTQLQDPLKPLYDYYKTRPIEELEEMMKKFEEWKEKNDIKY